MRVDDLNIDLKGQVITLKVWLWGKLLLVEFLTKIKLNLKQNLIICTCRTIFFEAFCHVKKTSREAWDSHGQYAGL